MKSFERFVVVCALVSALPVNSEPLGVEKAVERTFTLVKNSETGIEVSSVYAQRKLPGFCPAKDAPKPRLEEYFTALETALIAQWSPPKGKEVKAVSVIFKVDLSGNISHLRLFESSGDDMTDLQALKTVEHLKKFKPLPANSPGSIDIVFRFDSGKLEQKNNSDRKVLQLTQ